MFVVLGATGHVGSAVVAELLARGERVIATTRSGEKAAALERQGASAAVVDVRDVDALREVFRRGRRAFLLNPPADPSTDTDVEERATVRCILAALEGSGLEKVVAESTYGAQPGERIGDLSVLYELEEGLRAQRIPATVQRAAYYMSNWDSMLDVVRDRGVLRSFFPRDMKLPMVAPRDLGRAAAKLLLEPPDDHNVKYVEGPQHYCPTDVAASFARALGRAVEVEVTPREHWTRAFREQGFSDAAAESYARMTAATVDGDVEAPHPPVRGQVTLASYISSLVPAARAQAQHL